MSKGQDWPIILLNVCYICPWRFSSLGLKTVLDVSLNGYLNIKVLILRLQTLCNFWLSVVQTIKTEEVCLTVLLWDLILKGNICHPMTAETVGRFQRGFYREIFITSIPHLNRKMKHFIVFLWAIHLCSCFPVSELLNLLPLLYIHGNSIHHSWFLVCN